MSLTPWQKRVLQAGGDPWSAKYDPMEPELAPADLRAVKPARPDRDLDEVDSGLLGPSVDTDKAFDEDHRRAMGLD